MGIETALFLALSVISASGKMNQAKSAAGQTVANGEIAAKEKAKEVRYKVARQTSSFLNSGLTLEGTPQDVIGDTFDTGLQDIGQIRTNANNQSKNIISSARSEAIGQIAGSFGMAAMSGGSAGSMFETAGSYAPDSFAYGLNKAGFGNSAYDMLSLKDARV